MTRRMSLLNHLSFSIYWTPHVLMCLMLLVAYPLLVVWGWVSPARAKAFTDGAYDWMGALIVRVKESRDRLTRTHSR